MSKNTVGTKINTFQEYANSYCKTIDFGSLPGRLGPFLGVSGVLRGPPGGSPEVPNGLLKRLLGLPGRLPGASGLSKGLLVQKGHQNVTQKSTFRIVIYSVFVKSS